MRLLNTTQINQISGGEISTSERYMVYGATYGAIVAINPFIGTFMGGLTGYVIGDTVDLTSEICTYFTQD